MNLARFGTVTFLEILIIHFSVGAPFGVLEYFGGGQNHRLLRYARTSIAVIFWPILLALRLKRRISATLSVKKLAKDRIPESELEAYARSVAQTLNSEVKTTFDDYVCLSLSRSRTDSNSFSGYAEFLSLAGNNRPNTGSACLGRKRNSQVVDRLQRSRSELVGTFKMAGRRSNFDAAAIADVCDKLGDQETGDRLRAAMLAPSLKSKDPSKIPVTNQCGFFPIL